MKRTTRGEKILDQMVSDPSHPLTEDGKNFLIQVLDPNHDRPFRKVGWVDNNTRPSVLRMVKQSMPISAVSGGGAPVTAPWDCHIALSPYSSATPVSAVASRSNSAMVLNDGQNIMPFTGLRAVAQFSSGSDVVWQPVITSGSYLGGLFIDPSYLNADTRLVGVAFEVTDSSAEINKQGTLTAYAYPQDGPTDFYAGVLPGTSNTLKFVNFMGRRIYYPPNSAADAMLLPDTKQWEAKFGAYMVPTFQDIHNPPSSNSATIPVFENSLTQFPVNAVISNTCWIPDFTSFQTTTSTGTAINADVSSPNYTHFFPINSSGVILSGLNPNSTFNVTLTYIMEEIPNLTDKSSIVLTQPPPSFDPYALELYTRIAARLPPGVYVGENESGEWFWNLVEQVAEIAGPILSMIPHPVAQGGAALAKGITTNKKQRQTKKKKKPEMIEEKESKKVLVKAQPKKPQQKRKP